MEPGGIEPDTIPSAENTNKETDPQRATLRATSTCPDLSQLVELWPRLSAEVRRGIVAIASAAAAQPEAPADQQTAPCFLVGRSNGRQAVQCEHGEEAGGTPTEDSASDNAAAAPGGES